MQYLTRHMTAMRDMYYGGRDLQPGDTFVPLSSLDAEYLERHNRARFQDEQPQAVEQMVVPRRRGRPRKVE